MNEKKKIEIYTDGACNPNPGPGGWGVVILYPNQEIPVEMNGGEANTTNNQMELMASIKGLESFTEPQENIVLYTDSKYIRKGITQWIDIWKKNGWQTTEKKSVKNESLWKRLDTIAQKHQVTWKWVKGHAGNQWNERADELARKGIPKVSKILPLDDQAAIHIFTGVSFLTKEKIGGWASYLRFKTHTRSICGKVDNTSSNRMHILSAVQGLQLIKKKYPVHIYTVSGYLKDAASRWIHNWQKNNWQTKEGKPVKHKDLWITLNPLVEAYQLSWHLVSKKHSPEEMSVVKEMARSILKNN
ncbi:MAG: ribonuclease HI [Candidatus Magnetomorum sp.]|nr:ribonuclease HI [Candidatus Magnetomorum sp.]